MSPMNPITLTINGEYTDTAYVPPRCRKPRRTTFDAQTTVTIDSVTGDDAPLAFRVPLLRWDCYTPEAQEKVPYIRAHHGKLWTPCTTYEGRSTSLATVEVLWPDNTASFTAYCTSEEEWAERARTHFASFLIIEGIPHQLTTEPGYYVSTTGMGANHGGTSLWVAGGPDGAPSERLAFTALEYDEAVEHAVSVAIERGDTNSTDWIRNTEPIEVFDPHEVLTVPPAHEPLAAARARIDLGSAVREYKDAVSGYYEPATPERERELWEKITQARQDILAAGGVDIPGYAANRSPERREDCDFRLPEGMPAE